MRFLKRLYISIIICLIFPQQLLADGSKNTKLEQLQTEMYRLFYQDDSLQFREVIRQLKDECEKVGNETRGSAKASGMDLAICSTIAKLLGVMIWLDESYENGSRFIFEIPKE